METEVEGVTVLPAYGAAASAVAVAIGALGPWAKVTTIFGSVSVDGLSGDGRLTLTLALVALVVACWMVARPTFGKAIAGVLLFGAIALTGLYDTWHVAERPDVGAAPITVGWGLVLTVIGGLTGVVASVLQAREA